MHHAAAIFLPRSAYRIEAGVSNGSEGEIAAPRSVREDRSTLTYLGEIEYPI